MAVESAAPCSVTVFFGCRAAVAGVTYRAGDRTAVMPVTDTARTIAMICARLQWWPDPHPLRDAYVITLVLSRAAAGRRRRPVGAA